jgi:hypothetical protein
MRNALKLTAAFACLAALAGCNLSSCGNEVSQSIPSPSGALKAVVFNRNCGATTGFNIQVSIVPANGEFPNDGGNTLIIDGSAPLKVQWRSDSALHLAGLGAARVFKQEDSVAGVTVDYSTKLRPNNSFKPTR